MLQQLQDIIMLAVGCVGHQGEGHQSNSMAMGTALHATPLAITWCCQSRSSHRVQPPNCHNPLTDKMNT